MADIFSKNKRSEIMSRISGKETKSEILVRKRLFSLGFRYRKNDKRYPGSPDILLPKYRTALFIHGCLWHGHKNCSKSKMPTSNSEFWKNKINLNIHRDQKVLFELKKLGWNTIIIWSCEINNNNKIEERLSSLIHELNSFLANKAIRSEPL